MGLQRSDHGLGNLRGRKLQLVGHDGGTVAVEPPLCHGGVQPTEPVGLRRSLAVSLDGSACGAEPHRLLDPPLGVCVRGAESRSREISGVEGHPARNVNRLSNGAVLAP